MRRDLGAFDLRFEKVESTGNVVVVDKIKGRVFEV